jgi:arylsulfatase A-like enzyme
MMKRKTGWYFLVLYLAILGSFCGLEIDTYNGDLPFFKASTLLLFLNILAVILLPPVLYILCNSIRYLRADRAARFGILFLNAVYFHLVAFLLLYKAVRKTDFDFYFFWYNTADALPALWKLFAPWFLVFALSVAAFIFIQRAAFSPVIEKLGKSTHKAGFFLATVVVLSLLCQLATLKNVRASTAGFVYTSFLTDRQIRNGYLSQYRQHILSLESDTPSSLDQSNPSKLGDIIFFVKQESLNGLLTGPKITPQLLRASQDGILLEKQYGNSIQSIRGYGCILCGVPPSITEDLADAYLAKDLQRLPCLPQIFKALGYHTLYFFGGSRNPRIEHFAKSIGFEKVLADEIVHPGDVKFDWGYREDIFFARVDEYIQKHSSKEKLFVFIDTGATNHDPFQVLNDKLLDKIPYPLHTRFEEHLSNTTFVQDSYFGKFYDIFQKHYADRASLLAVSDHSWPIPIHELNIYNERGAYEENFLITMLFVPPLSRRNDFEIGSRITQRFSQMDILPTYLDLIGLKQNYLLGESFAPWLLSSQHFKRLAPRKIKVSVQPYGGGYISAVVYPKKYLFDVLGQKVEIFDLAKDPREQFPVERNADKYLYLLNEFFQSDIPE